MKKYLTKFYVVTLSLTTLFVVFFIFLYAFASNIVEDMQEEILVLELDQLHNDLMQSYYQVETTLNNLSLYLEQTPDDSDLLSYLISIDQESSFISSIYLGKPDLSMVNSSGFVPGPGFDLTTRLWYQLAINQESIIFTPVFLNASQDKLIVTAAKAVTINDIFIGVIATDIDITAISTMVSERAIGTDGSAFLIDQNHIFLAYPDMNYTNLMLTESIDVINHLNFVDEHALHRDFTYQGVNGVFAHQRTFNDTYFLAVFIPNQEFYQNSIYFFYLFLILLIVMISLSLLLFIINQKNIISPMKRLVDDIEKLDILDNPYDQVPDDSNIGFLEIREAINRNLNTTTSYFMEKEKARHDLLIENQRYNLLINSTADIIFEINLEKKFLTVVGKGLETIGLPASSFIGKTVLETFGDEGKERDSIYDQALNGHKGYYMWTFTKNKKIYYFESSISPIYDEYEHIIGAVGISRDITEQQEKQNQIEFISFHDDLTGLYNRRYFVEKLAEYDQISFYPLGIMMMDLNGLKIFNDAYGHLFGDLALSEIGLVLKSSINSQKHILSRIGGDEFSIILPNTSLDEMDRIKLDIYQKITHKKIENLQLSLSIGQAIKKDNKISIERLLKQAEDDMYRNKLSEGMSVRNNAIHAILKTLTDKYADERKHLEHVSQICVEFGSILKMSDDEIKELKLAGLYHDIGKISIPDAILNKPGKLTDEEYEIMKTHTEAGYQILRAADLYSNLAEYALTHHERWDGFGYPRKLKEKQIPYFSRIIAIIDAYEAMTSDRVYRKKMSKQAAIDELVRCSGTQFDPELTTTFVYDYLLKK